MEALVLASIAFAALAIFGAGQTRGLPSLPSILIVYLCCTYVGGLRYWVQSGSNIYLYVLCEAACFIAGLWLAQRYRFGRKRIPPLTRTPVDPGIHPQILLYTLAILTTLGFVISIYGFWQKGIPLISGNPSVNWVESTSGAGRRLIGSLGSGNLGFCAMGWYVLYKLRPKRAYLLAALGCVSGAAVSGALEGSKGSAIMSLLWFSIAVFYFSRRTPRLKSFALMAIFALPITFWTMSYYLNTPGETPVSIFANRLTTTELGGFNFLVQAYVPRYGALHGKTYRMDVDRIESQFTSGDPHVVFHEYIWNLMHGTKPYDSLKLSEDLSLFGVQYADFGIPGAMLSLLLFGIICELLDSYLISASRIHFLLFAAEMVAVSSLFMIFTGGDILIIGIEQPLISLIPKLAVFTMIYCALALPFHIPLNWKNGARKKTVQTSPNTAPQTGIGALTPVQKRPPWIRKPARG